MGRVRAVYDMLLARPKPEDIQSVLSGTTLSMIITIGLALVCLPMAAVAMDWTFASLWFGGTVVLCVTILLKARAKRDIKITRVSRKLMRRLLGYQVLLALPFAIFSVVMLGYGASEWSNYIAWPAAGLAAGGAAILRRTFLAAVIYIGALIASVLVGILIAMPPNMILLFAIVVIYGAFLFCLSAFMGQTERDRDRSVAELSAAVEELEHAHSENRRLANVDLVTGLANRNAFTEHLQKVTSAQAPAALFLLDLDRFKNVNDTFGHGIGDQLIAVIGARLQDLLGARARVGRLGGDEFAILVPDIAEEAEIAAIARDVLDRVGTPASLAGRRVYPSTSIGIATYPAHGRSPAALLLAADVALNRTKERGSGAFLIFDETLRAQVVRTDRIEAALRAALEHGDIHVFYQPKICLLTDMYKGAEALVRWHDDSLGPVSPNELLLVAAERGLMPQLSRYISDRIGTDILSWRAAGLAYGRIAINVHPVDLKSPELLFQNIARLRETGVTAQDLIIEVTEGCFVGRGNEAAILMLDTLAEQGYDISLDDFGTGHASLSHLRGLPVNELKIDRTFVSGLETNANDRAIVAATQEIASGMGIRSVAEGVETAEQLQTLKKIGVEIGQGYYWAPPLPLSDFVTYLSRAKVANRAPLADPDTSRIAG